MAENELQAVQKGVADSVANRVRELSQQGDFAIPKDYDYVNALKSAELRIVGTKDKNGKSVLDTCTKKSIAQALLDMVLQGLSPERTQCYFIAYGNELQLIPSYFGKVASLKRIVPEVDKIVCDIAHVDDVIAWGRTEDGVRYADHIETDPMKNHDKPIYMGFCNIYSKDGKLLGNAYMTYKEIETCWKHNVAYGKTKTHTEFPEEMAKKVLIGRACKFLKNTAITSVNSLAADAYMRAEKAEFKFDEDKNTEKPKAASTTTLSKAEQIKAKYVQQQAEEPQPSVAEKNPEPVEQPKETEPYPEEDFFFPNEVQQ